MKKKVITLVLSALMLTGLVGCGNNNNNSSNSGEATLKVGMITDSGTIDDKSFNQGTWEGIVEAEENLGIEKNYLKPSGETEADYLTEIQNLYDSGYKFIIGPGFKLETAIYKAQQKYEDAKFVILDGAPMDENGNYVVADNSVAIQFAEE
ncbi:MAG: BMP family ABC transporter substrate-binding protein, partial [Clostridium celatum]|nr:BMP family ABC transporter substrate-binding protein [Clostridium celatum]